MHSIPAGAAGILLGSMRQPVTTIVADVIWGLTVSRVGQVDFTSRNPAAQWEMKEDFPVWTSGDRTREPFGTIG